MKVIEGDIFREKSSGQLFRVRRINGELVILESEDRPNNFLIGDGILDFLFDRVESERELLRSFMFTYHKVSF